MLIIYWPWINIKYNFTLVYFKNRIIWPKNKTLKSTNLKKLSNLIDFNQLGT